jgi:GT2 family glycosyltransferase
MTMRISVVIATYNRADLLEACLRQLEGQAFLPGDEIVVADNGSADRTPRVVEDASVRVPGRVRLVTEPRPGKSNAVAAAVAEAHGDVLAFTDDDVLVDEDWIASIRHAMAGGDAALVGGPVLPLYTRRVPDWLDLDGEAGFGRMAAPLGLLHYGQAPIALGPRVVLGANVAVRRDAFLAVGGYPSHLGKLRGTLLSGEDHDLCERIQAAGYAAVYDPSVRVRHRVPAERLRPTYFLRWFFWSGVTHAVLDRQRPPAESGRRVLGAPGYVIRDLADAGARSVGAALRASWSGLAEHATRVAFAAGYLWATWAGHGPGRVAASGRPVEAA